VKAASKSYEDPKNATLSEQEEKIALESLPRGEECT
jgi:hypothetical protein